MSLSSVVSSVSVPPTLLTSFFLFRSFNSWTLSAFGLALPCTIPHQAAEPLFLLPTFPVGPSSHSVHIFLIHQYDPSLSTSSRFKTLCYDRPGTITLHQVCIPAEAPCIPLSSVNIWCCSKAMKNVIPHIYSYSIPWKRSSLFLIFLFLHWNFVPPHSSTTSLTWPSPTLLTDSTLHSNPKHQLPVSHGLSVVLYMSSQPLLLPFSPYYFAMHFLIHFSTSSVRSSFSRHHPKEKKTKIPQTVKLLQDPRIHQSPLFRTISRKFLGYEQKEWTALVHVLFSVDYCIHHESQWHSALIGRHLLCSLHTCLSIYHIWNCLRDKSSRQK